MVPNKTWRLQQKYMYYEIRMYYVDNLSQYDVSQVLRFNATEHPDATRRSNRPHSIPASLVGSQTLSTGSNSGSSPCIMVVSLLCGLRSGISIHWTDAASGTRGFLCFRVYDRNGSHQPPVHEKLSRVLLSSLDSMPTTQDIDRGPHNS